MVDMLREHGAAHIRVVVGGGGTIAPDEIEALEAYGVEKIYTPEDGRRLGLVGMIDDVFARVARRAHAASRFGAAAARAITAPIARAITLLEGARRRRRAARIDDPPRARRKRRSSGRRSSASPAPAAPARSSLNDELLQRFLRHFPDRQIAVVAIDPTRRRSGGALLGDRIRMNSLAAPQCLHALAGHAPPAPRDQRGAQGRDRAVPQLAGFDLIVVETAGIGQSRHGDRRPRRTSRCT